MTTFEKLPTVLAFDRKLEPSDGLMFSGNWQQRDDKKLWQPIELFERRNRAVKSNFIQEVLNDEEELQKQITKPNLAWGDDAVLKHGHDTLKLCFSLRIVSGINKPSVCNDTGFEARFSEVVESYVDTQMSELAQRYACNIANGRFLWRNRVGAEEVEIHVSSKSLPRPLKFNAYDYDLNSTGSDHSDVVALAQAIEAGLKGEASVVLNIEAFTQLGDAQRIWPSQEMVLKIPEGEKSRHLFQVDGVAAMHCEKIGNALRAIDDWYPQFDEVGQPIAVEAYGSVTQRGVAYRSSKNDFKTLLLKWLNAEEKKEATLEEKHFVTAMLIRGGVFGEGES